MTIPARSAVPAEVFSVSDRTILTDERYPGLMRNCDRVRMRPRPDGHRFAEAKYFLKYWPKRVDNDDEFWDNLTFVARVTLERQTAL